VEEMDGVTEGAATADLGLAVQADPELAQIEAAVSRATQALLTAQREDGHFVFELEADVSIPAEYILFKHYLGEPADAELEAKIAAFIRRQQAAHDGWPLFTDGAFNISSSVKAYFALKAAGDSPEADHLRRARAAILAHGGGRRTSMFSRAPCWRSSARCLGAACRSCRSRSCFCRAGFLST
jgi:squalene-hopene/tetraprenyl-beta-curcumene cyclase